MKNRWRKPLTIVVASLLVPFILLFEPFAIYDYGLVCSRCLYYEHHAEGRLLGLPLWRFATGSREDQYASEYARIFGQPCTHNFKKSGFGYRCGCGVTAEGSLFQNRNRALGSMFQVFERTNDSELARATFAIIEKFFPERTTVKGYYKQRHEGIEDTGLGNLYMLNLYLEAAKTTGEWRQVLEAAQTNFKPEPLFTKLPPVQQ